MAQASKGHGFKFTREIEISELDRTFIFDREPLGGGAFGSVYKSYEVSSVNECVSNENFFRNYQY